MVETRGPSPDLELNFLGRVNTYEAPGDKRRLLETELTGTSFESSVILAFLVVEPHVVETVKLGGADHCVPLGAGGVFDDASV